MFVARACVSVRLRVDSDPCQLYSEDCAAVNEATKSSRGKSCAAINEARKYLCGKSCAAINEATKSSCGKSRV